jgi:FixJ family two-component response regulator
MGNLICVVDDDNGFLRAMGRLLRAQGFEVGAFASAEDFQESVGQIEPSCLILDVNLGGISGIDLVHRMSRSGTRIPVVFVTANDTEDTREAAVVAGCVAYLRKPVTRSALMQAVGEALRADRSAGR